MKTSALRIGALSLLLLSIVTSCGGEDTSGPESTLPPGAPGAAGTGQGAVSEDDTVIVIGNHTDLTGPSSGAMAIVDMALDDLVRYYNEEGLIPGIGLEVVKYDGQVDPSRDIAGYEWLKERGADLYYTGLPNPAVTLQSRLKEDAAVLFAATVSYGKLPSDENVFCVGILPELEAYTLLKWVAENHWDYRANGPARIGGAGWTDDYSPPFFEAAEEYSQAHPDQFEWVGGYLTNFTFAWDTEVQALRDADYVIPPTAFVSFARQYRDGGGKATMLTTDTQVAFMGLVGDADLWDELDGMLALRSTKWWGEKGPLIDRTNEILQRYHGDDAAEIRRRGSGYLGITHAYIVVDTIRRAAGNVGAANVDGPAILEAAKSVSLVVDGVERFSFGPDKRFATNYYRMYRLDGAAQDLVAISDNWFPVALGP